MARNGKSFVKFWCAVLKLAFKSINHLYNAALVGAAWQHHPSKRGFVRMAVDFYHWPSFTFIQFCVRFGSICKYFTCWHQVLKLWVCCFSLPRIPLLCIISIKFDNIIYILDFFCIKKNSCRLMMVLWMFVSDCDFSLVLPNISAVTN